MRIRKRRFKCKKKSNGANRGVPAPPAYMYLYINIVEVYLLNTFIYVCAPHRHVCTKRGQPIKLCVELPLCPIPISTYTHVASPPHAVILLSAQSRGHSLAAQHKASSPIWKKQHKPRARDFSAAEESAVAQQRQCARKLTNKPNKKKRSNNATQRHHWNMLVASVLVV